MRQLARPRRHARVLAVLGGAIAVSCACTGESTPEPTPSASSPAAEATRSAPSTVATSPESVPRPTVTVSSPTPVVFDASRAYEFVEHLAGQIGPREAASQEYAEAADYVAAEFERLGYQVSTEAVAVPAGDSWGVPVDAGESANILAGTSDYDVGEPHIVIGAHLDTVAAAPGAEDNASGTAVLLELARMAAAEPPDLPMRFIAFGAEEPRGEGDDMHHFGSQQYVAELSSAQRDAVVAMVSLDRVGVAADAVPVCTGGTGTVEVRDGLIEAADRAGIDAETCENRASDHWSFEKAEIPASRLGSVPYAGYHSADDVPSVVDPGQLGRVGRITWEWLSALSM